DPVPKQIFDEIKEKVKHEVITIIVNKIDLTDQMATVKKNPHYSVIGLSAKTGLGIDLLRKHLKSSLGYDASFEEGAFTARRRHLEAIEIAHNHLKSGQTQRINKALELLAEELRLAHQALGEITGEFTSEDLLGKIFSNFCIGK